MFVSNIKAPERFKICKKKYWLISGFQVIFLFILPFAIASLLILNEAIQSYNQNSAKRK